MLALNGITDFATYGADGVTAATYANVAGVLTTISGSTNPADNISLPQGDTVTASKTINALNTTNSTVGGNGGANVNINGGQVLTLNSGGLIMGGEFAQYHRGRPAYPWPRQPHSGGRQL